MLYFSSTGVKIQECLNKFALRKSLPENRGRPPDCKGCMAMIRKHIYYKGRVQGVGFRYTALRTARNFEVTGYVQNQMDGSVELVVEGESPQVEEFLADLARAMGRYIQQVQEVEEPYEGGFMGFDVKY